MNAPSRLIAFAVVLALAFGGAALAGAAIDPTQPQDSAAGMGGDHASAGHGAMAPAGIAVSDGSFTLVPQQTVLRAGTPQRWRFRIADPKGRAVRDGYELESTRELHLIVVRRDGTGYQHLHPVRDRSGTWSVALTLPAGGVYRAFADFQIHGRRHTLGTDLFVPGAFRPRPWPAPQPLASADGFDVALGATTVHGGGEHELAFRVTRGGRPVDALQPYLGAKGHLVALREGDLAYLHVHPDAAPAAANEIRFMAELPSAGRYRLFLQFKTAGRVHTVADTLEVTP